MYLARRLAFVVWLHAPTRTRALQNLSSAQRMLLDVVEYGAQAFDTRGALPDALDRALVGARQQSQPAFRHASRLQIGVDLVDMLVHGIAVLIHACLS